jgi:23S rRNA-/tRNA-specific pseudouridylate synthase
MYRDYATRISDLEFKSEAQTETQQSEVQKLQIENRLCLHACGLAFHHPDGGAWMEFVSPAPDSLQAIIRQYQKS